MSRIHATPAAEGFAEEILRIITTAKWPDGSLMVDVDLEVLRDAVEPRLRAAAYALRAAAIRECLPRGRAA